MLPVVVVCWRYDFRCFTISQIISVPPMVPPPVRQSLHGKSHLQCREIGVSPVLQEEMTVSPRKSSYVIRGFLVQCYFLTLYLLTRIIKICFKMFTYSCQAMGAPGPLEAIYHFNIIQLICLLSRASRGSAKTKGCTSFLKTLEFQASWLCTSTPSE